MFGVIIVLSCEKLHSSARDFLWLEHLFKANVSTSIPILYIKTKSTEMTVIVTISFLPIRTGFFTISTKSDRFDPKICRATLVLLSWCDISVICCLNVIPAGSFSLSLSLPLSFFFSFPHANEPVCRLLPIIFTDYSVEIY